MANNNRNTKKRGLAAADEKTRQRVSRAGGKASRGGRGSSSNRSS